MVACTGNVGCKFALSDTQRHGLELVDYLDGRLALDQPINIHLTGCPNSCAQHYVGDIGSSRQGSKRAKKRRSRAITS
jgi:ferredoxin-nitrite reductase